MTSDAPRPSRNRPGRAACPAGAARPPWPGNMRLAVALSLGLWGLVGLAARALLG